jgi:hypothetical protein
VFENPSLLQRIFIPIISQPIAEQLKTFFDALFLNAISLLQSMDIEFFLELMFTFNKSLTSHTMKRKILITVALLLSFGAAFAYFAGLDGKWSAMLKGPDGNEFPISYTFKTDGTALTGTVTSSLGTFDISDGIVKGDSLWFTANIKTMKIKNIGRYYADGDSVSLRVGKKSTHTTLKRAIDK